MTTVPLAEARQNFSALVDEATATHQRVLVTRNGVPVIRMIADEDFESIMETLDVLADAAAMRDVAQSQADAQEGRYVTVGSLPYPGCEPRSPGCTTRRRTSSSRSPRWTAPSPATPAGASTPTPGTP